MSAILKALKKLEQETPTNGGAPLPGIIKGQGKRRAKSILVTGLILLPLCILIGAGFMLFVRKSSVPESPPLFLKEEKSVSVAKTPEKNKIRYKTAEIDKQNLKKQAVSEAVFEFPTAGPSIVDNHQTDAKNGVRELPDTQPQKMSPEMSPILPRNLSDFGYATASVKTADPFSPIMPPPKRITPAAEDENTRPIEEKAEPSAPLQPAIRTSEAHVPASTDNTFSDKPAVIRKTEPPVAVIEDSAIELQAISWSADADKRMAIINGKICREKDRVAGYVVQSIHSGEVILSKGSVSGKLVFEIR